MNTMIDKEKLKDDIIRTLKMVFDPEIPVNIYDLGMIYELDVTDDGDVTIKMTLTTPACPVAGTLPGEVEQRIRNLYGVRNVDLQLVWEPPWNTDMMSEEAKLTLGFL